LTADHHVVDPGPSRQPDASARAHVGDARVLAALWVAVIVLAVAVDLAK
jgi:hypothetical protein